VADDLSNHFRSSPVVGLGSAFLSLQCRGPLLREGRTELKVALPAEAELLGGLAGSQALAFPFDEHGQLVGDLVVLAYRQNPAGSDQQALLEIEFRHDCFLLDGLRAY